VTPSSILPDAPCILVVHGPNLNLLGDRETHIYGKVTLKEIDDELCARGHLEGVRVECFQSNYEGELIDRLHVARANHASGLIINAGGLTHTSVSLRDAVSALAVPSIEVHLSNLYAREEFRHQSFLAPVCLGQIAGLGAIGYRLALEALVRILQIGAPESHPMLQPKRKKTPKSLRRTLSIKKGIARK
jgi:3-dehydroquinate dehydratase-2